MGFARLFYKGAAVIVAVGLATVTAAAGEVDVQAVDARQAANGSWTFSVTLRHDDEGWDHYADRWDVVGPDGTVYGERVLLHPHVEEQPFTRSLSGVEIPEGVNSVTVRGHDKVHGFGGAEFTIDLQAGK
ncbi:hypothetical protein K1W69_24775 [Hoeflea sp. WL0058]|uniref:Uncharacterized protein n=2 Tax=Flavimaribacter sediminis TaxID=2865987 RepID=A0AAE2ZP49_9HYPH|nr:hypothetical protein [Flavimaribacter sediminis]MBW8640429.1 hypothetical protein [Flavimaribacter sediminis]